MTACSYAVISNIPGEFHAADLRGHFSSLIESRSFYCFHYRHRPEKEQSDGRSDNQSKNLKCCVVKIMKSRVHNLLKQHEDHWTNGDGDVLSGRCTISLIQVKTSSGASCSEDAVDEETLLSMPELRPPELMPNGNVGTPTLVFFDYIQRCLLPRSLISKLHLHFPKAQAKTLYGKMDFDYGTSNDDDGTTQDLVESSNTSAENIEPANNSFNPKAIQRNSRLHETGASENSKITDVSHESENTVKKISTTVTSDSTHCDLDEKLTKLTSSDISLNERQPVIDETDAASSDKDEDILFAVPALPKERNLSPKMSGRERKRKMREERRATKKLMVEGIEERLIAVEKRYHNDEDAEEWDRHEASEDDPSNQERNKERLYEEEIEQPWEKGGPGVVFYTDAMFWQEKEGDFDEQTSDDLDVDFSAYEEAGAGDKDIKDFLKIRQEKRFRSGYDETDRFSIGIGKRVEKNTALDKEGVKEYHGRQSESKSSNSPNIGEFERHTKGIGRKVMESQGWREGQGLGSSRQGIVDALKGVGQKPLCKRGLGFVQEEPIVYGPAALMRKQVKRGDAHLITTVYDNPEVVDPKVPQLQRSEPTTLKHRQSHVDKFS